MNFENPEVGDRWPYRYKYFGSAGVECGKKKDPLRNVRLIGDHRLWYSDPSALNDPFDCLPDAEERSIEKLTLLAERMYRKFPGLYHPDKPDLTKEEIIARMAGEMAQQHRGEEFVNRFFSQFSILCLSRDAVNQLMWAHYGNSHRGFAMEFSLLAGHDLFDARQEMYETDPRKYLIDMVPVRTSDVRPHFDGDHPTDMLTTKSTIWAYEREERIVRGKPAGFEEFAPEILASVILGVFSTDRLKDQVEYQIERLGTKGKHIKVYKAAKHKSDFRIWIPDHPYYGNINYKDPDTVYPPADPEMVRG